MPNSRSQELLKFAHLQMAAEAFLDGFNPDTARDRLINAFERGNRRASIFPTVLAEEFADQWVVVDHEPNKDGSGFSGTLFRSRVADPVSDKFEYTLSLRSTEFVDDAVRDAKGAGNLEIRQLGWALAQISDMEAFYARLKQERKLPADTPFNVTGYSLGGHLALAFALMRREEDKEGLLKHVYTFNGAGTGGVRFGFEVSSLVKRFDRLRKLAGEGSMRSFASLSDMRDANSRLKDIFAEVQRLDAFKDKSTTFLDGKVPPAGTYATFAHQLAAVLVGKSTIASQSLLAFGDISTVPTRRTFASTRPFENMTELFGADGGQSGTSLVDGRFSFVSFSGQHYSKPENSLGVYIEDQPLARGNYSFIRDLGRVIENPRENDYADTHSLVLLVDSLALMSAMTQLDPNLTQVQIEAIFKAASNSKAQTINGTQGEAEGDTLERVLDSLRRVFLGPNVSSTSAPLDGNTWHNLDNRQAFHSGIKGLVSRPAFQAAAGQVSVKALPISASEIEAAARGDIAYRFALRNLDAFAVTGQPSLFSSFNQNGELDLFDPATGRGAFTKEYLADRAAMLAARLDMAHRNSGFSSGGTAVPSILYNDTGASPKAIVFDSATATDIARTRDSLPIVQRDREIQRLFDSQAQRDKGRYVRFGRDADPDSPVADPNTTAGGRDQLEGGKLDDCLYGGGGNDALRGGLGNDHLEGGVGDDILRGGATSAALPFGFTDNDSLVGGKGSDVLDGGLGTDKYYFYTGGGADEVFDAAEGSGLAKKQLGEIYFNDVRIAGTLIPNDPDKKNYTFNSPDGLYRAAYLGDVNTATPGKLVLWKDTDGSNVVTLNNFISGDFGIVLDPNAPVRQYTEKLGTAQADNGDLTQTPHQGSLASDANDQKVFGLAGADFITVSHANTQGFGGADNDYITNGANDQQLYGETGRDVLVATEGDDSLYGGTEDDALQGGADKDYLEGNEGSDVLDGGAGEDVIAGGDGHDFIFGGGSVMVDIIDWDGFADGSLDWGAFDAEGNVLIRGLSGFSNAEGDAADVITGGAGNDWVFAGDGNDAVTGGLDDDYLVGQTGNDEIWGEEGGDTLYGDGAEGDLSQAPGGFAVFTFPEFHGKDLLSGGAGNDFISGDGEADELYGDEGADTLVGDSNNVPEEFHGADYLDGGEGNDILLGYGKDDTLFGGAGDDNLGGDSNTIADNLHGDDYLDGEDGADIVHGDGGSDTVFGGGGDDTLDGDATNVAFEFHGDDYLEGEDGNDALQGGGGSDRLFGGSGNDSLNGDAPGVPVEFAGNDYLDGEGGDDVLDGGSGDDTLTGGAGADILIGGAGDDLYLVNLGSQNDFIQDREGTNTVRLGAAVSFVFQALGSDGKAYLGLRYSGSDIVHIQDGLTNPSMRYELPDGTVQTAADWRASFGQFIFTGGGSGADTLAGSALAQLFVPGGGNDTILFDRGSGFDRISGFGQVAGGFEGIDKVRLGAGITAGDLEIGRAGGLILTIRDTGDRLQIDNWLGDAANVHTGVQVEFADGSGLTASQLVALSLASTDGNDFLVGGSAGETIVGGAGNDIVQGAEGNDALAGGEGDDKVFGGTGTDTLDGGAGNDFLRGDSGADLYLYGAGDGNDVIEDTGADANVVQFKPSVAPGDVTLTQGSIVVTLNTTGETLTLPNWHGDDGGGSLDFVTVSQFPVNEFRFADGTVWDAALINEKANHSTPFADRLRGIFTDDTLYGLAGDDNLRGFSGDDVLSGGDGNDSLMGGLGADDLYGDAGNDTVDAGMGNDLLAGGTGTNTLIGGFGDDVYLVGEGNDLILEIVQSSTGPDGTWDVVRFNDSVHPENVRVLDDSGLRLVVDPAPGSGMPAGVTVKLSGDVFSHGIEEVRFADGTAWSAQELLARMVVSGRSLIGTGGNDALTGGAGDDMLDGGAGDDLLQGGLGGDVLLGGDGIDRLFAHDQSFNSQGDNAANQLDGGAGNDQLFGSTGADLLDGGAGQDELRGGRGDDALQGGEGNDSLIGDEGNDTLDGGAGNDQLTGGLGTDIYRLAAGGGHDIIGDVGVLLGLDGVLRPTGEHSVILIDAAFAPADLEVRREAADLLIAARDGSASFRLQNFATEFGPAAFSLIFADGTQWDTPVLVSMASEVLATGGDDSLHGTAGADILLGLDGNDSLSGKSGDDELQGDGGNDTLHGGFGNDLLDGGAGNDSLFGSYGNDVYVFGYGSGKDTISEAGNTLDSAVNRAFAGNRDTIRFAPNVRPEDVSVDFNSDSPEFRLSGSGDSLIITTWGDSAAGRVEFAEFADGTVWDLGKFSHWRTGTNAGPNVPDIVTGSRRHFSGQFGGTAIMGIHDELFLGLNFNDFITDIWGHNTFYGGGGNDSFSTGSGDDSLSGGAGNDTLSPGTGDNFIRFGRGFGLDTLNLSGVATNHGTDTVVLGQDVRAEHVRVRRGPNASLILEPQGTPDVLTINGSIRGLEGRERLRLQFADGTAWGAAEIEARLGAIAIIEGGTGNNNLAGGDGDDLFIGNEGSDTLTGGGGRDTFLFFRGDGSDTVIDDAPRIVFADGIRPQDVLLSGSNFQAGQRDLFINVPGQNFITVRNWFPSTHAGGIEFADGTIWDSAFVGTRVPYTFISFSSGSYTGTLGNDTFSLGSTADTMRGEAGDDNLSSDGGNDQLFGGTGNDTLSAGTGNDSVQGDAGNDTLFGGSGDDTLGGGDGDDVLDAGTEVLGAGESDADRLTGGEGNDALIGRLGNDALFGSPGDDALDGGEGNDSLAGGTGNDSLNAGAGDDLLEGEAGDDLLDGGTGQDRLYGGAGSDTYLFGLGAGQDLLLDFDATGQAVDTVRMGSGVTAQDVVVVQDAANLVLRIVASGDSLTVRSFGTQGYGVERVVFEDGTLWDGAQLARRAVPLAARERADLIFGAAGDDALAGLGGDDVLDGGTGADALDGGSGDDLLYGGTGDDVLDGGAGIDYLTGGAGGDIFVVNAGAGSDVVADLHLGDTVSFGSGISAADVRITRDREHLYLHVTTTAQFLTLENWFAQGAQGSVAFADGTLWNSAYLKASVDALTEGDDFFVAGEAADTIMPLAGLDTVFAGGGEDLVLGGAGSDTLYGEAGDDALSGDGGFDVLAGGAGNDTLDGGDDDDQLLGDGGDDTLLGGEGFDVLAGGSGNDLLDGQSGDDLLQGEAGNDVLVGGTGADSLSGGDGNDTLEGGADSDTLEGGLGTDIYRFSPGFGVDTLKESTAFDPAAVDTLRFSSVSPNSVSFAWVGNDVHLELAGTSDRVTIRDFFLSQSVERVEFDDGAAWGQPEIFARMMRHGTAGNDNLSSGVLKGLLGLGGDDTLNGGFIDNLLDGGDGADRLNGFAGNDSLLGGAGTDTIDGGTGNDALDGGAGNDSLTGGPGDDTYVFGGGYGEDVIFNADSIQGRRDVISLAADVQSENVTVARSAAHLVLTLNGGADKLRIDNWYGGPGFQIDEVRFADGTVWSAGALESMIVLPTATEGDDTLFGTSGPDTIDGLGGNDSISGEAGNDTLSGGPGNDTLIGGLGGDLYRFGYGFGRDTIVENDANTANIDVVSVDAPAAAVVVSRDFSNVYLALAGGADRVTLQSWFSGNAQKVEEVRFSDGTVWDADAVTILANGGSLLPPPGTEGPDFILGTSRADTIHGFGGNDFIDGQGGNDVLFGGEGNDSLTGNAGSDTLDGGSGSDTLNGGVGNDIYRFAAGYGSDTISDFDSTTGNVDIVEVNASAADAAVRRSGANLQLRLASGDLLVVTGWFSGAAQQVEQVRFTDGTTWDVATLDAMANAGFTYTGTAASDNIAGSNGPDLIEGLGGFDTLSGLAGDDTLLGGTDGDTLIGDSGNDVLVGAQGNDSLLGGLGDDVYRYSVGDGFDFINDSGGMDAVEFQAGIAPAGVNISRISNELLLGIAGGGSLQLSGWFSSATQRIETIRFANGTQWSAAFVLNQTRFTDGGDFVRGSGADDILDALGGDDSVYGGPGHDHLFGGAGDDVLGGEAGADTLDGGAGRDILSGDLGDDRYIFDSGYGDDWVTDSGGADEVIFGSALTPGNVVFTRDLANLFVASGADRLTLVDWFHRPEMRVENFRFADGTVFDEEKVRRRIVVSVGTFGNDTIFGSDVANQMAGSSGEDALYGEGGDDVLDGGQGTDYLLGGSGNDTYHVDHRLDRVTESAGEGVDTVIATATYTLSAHVENLTLSGTAAMNGTGNDLDNVIAGNVAANILDGSAGNDSMRGAAGNDIYRYKRGDGSDEVSDIDATPGNRDEVSFSLGIAPPQVRVARVDNDILLRVSGGGQLSLRNWFDPVQRIESVRFADGTTWDPAMIEFLSTLPSNQPPVVSTQLADQTALEDAGFEFALPAGTFSSADPGDSLTYRAEQADASALPGWLSFDPSTQTFSGTPAQADVGALDIRVTATDSGDLFIDDTFTVTVANVNDAPVIGALISDQVATEDASFQFEVPAATITDEDPGDALTWFAARPNDEALPGWLTFDASTHAFSGRPSNDDVGTMRVVVGATDASGATAFDVFHITVMNTNDAPTLAQAIVDQSAIEDQSFNFVVPEGAFADPDTGDTSTLSASLADGTALPTWLSFDASSRQLSGTPANADVGIYGLSILATDAAGATAADVFRLHVANVNDAPIVANGIEDQWFEAGTPFVFAVLSDTFLDVDAGDSLVLSAGLLGAASLPNWLTFDPSTASFAGNPQQSDIGISHIVVRATDAAGASANADFGLIVRAIAGSTVTGTPDDDLLYGGSGDERIIARGSNDYLFGDVGNDLLRGGTGDDVLQGGEGNDLLRAGTGQNLLDGGSGDDVIFGGSGDAFIAGGAGNDTIHVNAGNDVISFNRGDGWDTIYGGGDGGNTLSLGGGIRYSDLRLGKNGSDLVLDAGSDDRIVLKDWYGGARSVLSLQIVLDASEDYDALSPDPLYNRKVQRFDFLGMVSAFDDARRATRGLTSWEVTNALLQFHLFGADDMALGGDLAYWYAKNRGLGGISLAAAQQVIGASGFGSDAQQLRPFSGLQEGFVKLS